MRNVIAIAALVAGLLLLIVPRFILPACEYEGFGQMRCSDTAHAEFVIGGMLMAAGGIALAIKGRGATIAAAAASIALLGAGFLMPAVYGFCANRKMPCHYGMVPGIRFITISASLVLIAAAVLLVRDKQKERRQ